MNDLALRVVAVELSLDLLSEMLRLPANVEIVRVVPDYGFIPQPTKVRLILQSPDFPPVREGELARDATLVSESERHVTKTRIERYD